VILFSAVVCGLADAIWGGQAARISSKAHALRRVIAPFLVALSLVFFIGLSSALIASLGYVLVRVAGWRFFANRELFLPMNKLPHPAYAFTHSLLFMVIPAYAFFAMETPITYGVLYWIAVSALMITTWAGILFAARRLGRDLIPLKEAVWGGIFGGAAYWFFIQYIAISQI